jgi:hypothetical protein
VSTPMMTAIGPATPLAADDPAHPYVLREYTIPAGFTTPFVCATAAVRTYVVIDGRAEVDVFGDDRPAIQVDRLAGWHAPAGSVFRVHAPDGAVMVEAGTKDGELAEWPELPAPPVTALTPVADYTVDKPWGHEVWYTANLADPPYALKQIHMTAGHQSSLQSHRSKAETNYVVDGEATVLNGLPAPERTDTVIDVSRIPVRTHGTRSGWSSAPGILHRVIARSDYTSVEVSTPELDDVVRWQDDTGRGDGRVDAEHRAAAR